MTYWSLEPEGEEDAAHRRLMEAFYGVTLAEGVGFEPTDPVRGRRLSKTVGSATPPPFRKLH